LSAVVPIEEVNWGEAQEIEVVKLWSQRSELGTRAHRFVKSLDFDPYDVLVLAEQGLPLCALEVKVRRVSFGDYGDVMSPLKKREAALAFKALGIPFVLVTLYACGTIVEVDLASEPAQVVNVARRDRPGTKPIPHGLWKDESLTVLGEVRS
jgi:hypothetical protein